MVLQSAKELAPRLLALAVIVCTGLAMASAQAHADYLTSSQLRHLFPGQFDAVWKDKINVTLVATANGRLAGETWAKSDTGTWAVRGNRLCISFSAWTKTKCGPVRRTGDWYFGLIRTDGSPRLKFRRR